MEGPNNNEEDKILIFPTEDENRNMEESEEEGTVGLLKKHLEV